MDCSSLCAASESAQRRMRPFSKRLSISWHGNECMSPHPTQGIVAQGVYQKWFELRTDDTVAPVPDCREGNNLQLDFLRPIEQRVLDQWTAQTPRMAAAIPNARKPINVRKHFSHLPQL